ncbi:hypothetical protein [Methylobacterium sp. D54C]
MLAKLGTARLELLHPQHVAYWSAGASVEPSCDELERWQISDLICSDADV